MILCGVVGYDHLLGMTTSQLKACGYRGAWRTRVKTESAPTALVKTESAPTVLVKTESAPAVLVTALVTCSTTPSGTELRASGCRLSTDTSPLAAFACVVSAARRSFWQGASGTPGRRPCPPLAGSGRINSVARTPPLRERCNGQEAPPRARSQKRLCW
jgi:hypothetical protein